MVKHPNQRQQKWFSSLIYQTIGTRSDPTSVLERKASVSSLPLPPRSFDSSSEARIYKEMGSKGQNAWKLADHPKLPKGKTIAMVVLDGWGEARPDEYNCIHVADTPTMDSFKTTAP
ncbi:23-BISPHOSPHOGLYCERATE-INDEPENDENT PHOSPHOGLYCERATE MUTASE [Salix viminalis]|uniref:23-BISPHOSPHOGLYCERATE-INDEPENDENT PHOSPHOGLYCERATE MUTASE n=1 Tax=Salix viminalis TaxID=40686 RepID=A0A9Q0V643_SALVM|nr:23-BISPHOSPHOGLYCERATE-INDEPENDENT PHOSPHOGLYCERATE MUTASE [Salix viminalis]